MEKNLIFPMAVYVLYTWGLAILNFRTRIGAFRKGQVGSKYFKTLQGEAPERLITVGRHYDNQFQLPMLFFMTCLAHLIVAKANDLTVVLAWLFVVTRFLHSFVHLGSNNVIQRVMAFASGWLVIVIMWIQLTYFVL